jgi:hypothetical protein
MLRQLSFLKTCFFGTFQKLISIFLGHLLEQGPYMSMKLSSIHFLFEHFLSFLLVIVFWAFVSPVMSMPDALPTEIALIALPLFEFQVYSTSLLPQANHSFHIPITLSANYRPHGIDQRPAITSQEVLLSTGLAPYTHTVQPHTALATQSSIATSSLNFYQFS